MKKLVYSSLLCLTLASCGNDLSEALPDHGNWQPVLTRAEDGTKATIAGFASPDSYSSAFSKNLTSDGTSWTWENGSSAPSLNNVAILSATIPALTISNATRTLYQSEVSGFTGGLKLGAATLAEGSRHSIEVHQCLAQMNISCTDSYILNTSIDLQLCTYASVDFRTGILTPSGSSSPFTQYMENDRTATLTIFPQTFRRGSLLFEYWYRGGNTRYRYYLKEDYVVGPNQSLQVRVASGDEESYTKPDPKVTITVTSQVENWEEGRDKEEPGSAE